MAQCLFPDLTNYTFACIINSEDKILAVYLPAQTRQRVIHLGGEMGTYPLEFVIREWGKGNLTIEQVLGQVLLLLQQLEARICELERRQQEARRRG